MTNGAQESEVIHLDGIALQPRQSFRLALEQLPGRATNNRLLFQDRKGSKVRF